MYRRLFNYYISQPERSVGVALIVLSVAVSVITALVLWNNPELMEQKSRLTEEQNEELEWIYYMDIGDPAVVPQHRGEQSGGQDTQFLVGRRDACAPKFAGETPALPSLQARRLRSQVCRRDACAPKFAGETPALPRWQARRLRSQVCRRDA